MPRVEAKEVREIYATKGFSGRLLDQVVETITANRDRWVQTMMDEELRLQPVDSRAIFRSSIVIFIATLIGHLIPLLPFVWLSRTPALVVAIASSAAVLFGVGTYSALTRVGSWWKQGIRMLVIGLGAAAVGFAIGRLFNAAGA
jgi:predicted membrane protein (TIGR00267 family)